MNRRPAGTPSGGEFAPKSHGESDVSLAPEPEGHRFGEDLVDSLRKRLRGALIEGVDEVSGSPDPDDFPRTVVSITEMEHGSLAVEAVSEGPVDCPRCFESSHRSGPVQNLDRHTGRPAGVHVAQCGGCGRPNFAPSAYVVIDEDDDASEVGRKVGDLSAELTERVNEDLEERRGAAHDVADEMVEDAIRRLRNSEADIDDFEGADPEPGVSAALNEDGSITVTAWVYGPTDGEVIEASDTWSARSARFGDD